MKLYSRAEKKDAEKILEGVKAAYGNPDPIKTHGFAGTFLYSLGDVYLSDRIWALMISALKCGHTAALRIYVRIANLIFPRIHQGKRSRVCAIRNNAEYHREKCDI